MDAFLSFPLATLATKMTVTTSPNGVITTPMSSMALITIFRGPPGGGGPKIHMVNYVNESYIRRYNIGLMFNSQLHNQPCEFLSQKNSELNVCFF